MPYAVKTIYYTLQGEGAQAGRAAVFCRFSGCNLWSGREEDRADASCSFCDTDFVKTNGPAGGVFRTADELADAVAAKWPAAARANSRPLVVCTGGEPLLQLDVAAIAALHARGFEVAIETNGTRPAPAGLDWICVSPKGDTDIVLRAGNELKLVYPQADNDPEDFADLAFDHFWLQPLDNSQQPENTREALEYCLRHPQWRLCLQLHKILGIE